MTQQYNNNLALVRQLKELIVWFDLFNYPLTNREIQRYLACPVDLATLVSILPTIEGLATQHGFWFLAGRQAIVLERCRRVNYSDRKLKKATKLARAFAWLPWLSMVAVVNQIGSNNLQDDGDIDLLLICQPRRLWLSRLLLAACLKFLDLRPRPNHSRDTYCLSFLITEDNLNLAAFRQGEQDLYFRYWLAGCQPVWARPGVVAKFWSANAWLKQELPNWQAPLATRHRLTARSVAEAGHGLDNLEQLVQAWQFKRLPTILKTMANQDSRVVINASVIKLHSNDRRQQFMTTWSDSLKKI